MIEIKAPNSVPQESGPTIFLAGSIEMGKAEPWQEKFAQAMKDLHCTLVNPRRTDWDVSWKQSKDNPQFAEQVNWELDNLIAADIIVFYFDPKTYSPITLMELGYVAGVENTFVCCPEGFWRKGNVDILCQRANMPVVDTIEQLIALAKEQVIWMNAHEYS